MYVMKHLLGGPAYFVEHTYTESVTVIDHIAVVGQNLSKEALLCQDGWEFLGEIEDMDELDGFLAKLKGKESVSTPESEPVKQELKEPEPTKPMYVDTSAIFINQPPKAEWWQKK